MDIKIGNIFRIKNTGRKFQITEIDKKNELVSFSMLVDREENYEISIENFYENLEAVEKIS